MLSEVLVGGGGNRASVPRGTFRTGATHPVGTVIVVYIAVQHNPMFVHYATQFVSTYKQFEGGEKHKLIVCCNGGKLNPMMKAIFDGLDCHFLNRDYDHGWDISAYQDVARDRECDLLVCFGESVRFHRAGWLDRLVESAREYRGRHVRLPVQPRHPRAPEHDGVCGLAAVPQAIRAGQKQGGTLRFRARGKLAVAANQGPGRRSAAGDLGRLLGCRSLAGSGQHFVAFNSIKPVGQVQSHRPV